MKKIKCVVITSHRSELSILTPLLQKIQKHPRLELQLICMGSHLSKSHGHTIDILKKNQIKVFKKINNYIDKDSAYSILKSFSIAVPEISKLLTKEKPDIGIIMGDRFDQYSLALACLIHSIPMAHIHGGEKTLGAIDDQIRHSITKLAHIHFTTTEDYRKRVIQLGEIPKNVWNVGSPALELLKNIKLPTMSELEKRVGMSLKGSNYFLITMHPETTNIQNQKQGLSSLLQALEKNPNTKIIFTKPNVDLGGKQMALDIQKFVNKNKKRAVLVASLGDRYYWAACKYADVVIGNSSSGIIEVPSLHTPTVNIGMRQFGRVMGPSIFNSNYSVQGIQSAIQKAYQYKRRNKKIQNPYEGKNTTSIIVNKIIEFIKNNKSNSKSFYDLNFKI